MDLGWMEFRDFRQDLQQETRRRGTILGQNRFIFERQITVIRPRGHLGFHHNQVV